MLYCEKRMESNSETKGFNSILLLPSSSTEGNAMKRYTFFSIRWMRPNRLWTSWHRLLQGCRVFGKEWDEVIIFLPIYVFLGRYLWLCDFSIAGTYLHRSSVFASRRPVKPDTVNPKRMIHAQRDTENSFILFCQISRFPFWHIL